MLLVVWRVDLMNRPDLFLHGQSSFTDILAEMSSSLKTIAENTKKRPRESEETPTGTHAETHIETLTSIVVAINAFQKICSEEEAIDSQDAMELLRDIKSQIMSKIMKVN